MNFNFGKICVPRRSVCCTVDQEGRHYMDCFMRQHMRMNSSQFQLPVEGSIYDYLYDTSQSKWIPWMDTVGDSAFSVTLNLPGSS